MQARAESVSFAIYRKNLHIVVFYYLCIHPWCTSECIILKKMFCTWLKVGLNCGDWCIAEYTEGNAEINEWFQGETRTWNHFCETLLAACWSLADLFFIAILLFQYLILLNYRWVVFSWGNQALCVFVHVYETMCIFEWSHLDYSVNRILAGKHMCSIVNLQESRWKTEKMKLRVFSF